MKKFLYPLLALFSMVSCMETELSPVMSESGDDFYASIESVGATRTAMDENNNVLWSEEDQLVIFRKTTLGDRYQIKEQYVGTTTGGFSKISDSGSGDDFESGNEIDHNVAIYPYSTSIWCMKNDSYSPTRSYKLNVVLPEVQHYAENSFGNGSFPMIAVSSTNQLTFKNVCGGIKLQLKGVDKIMSIKLEGLGDDLISGKSTVVGYVDGSAPVITMDASKATKSITLDCGDGVQLKSDAATTFIISVPPVTFHSGMKLTITDADGMSRELMNGSSNTIKRSSLLTFPVITYRQEGVFEIEDGTLTTYELLAEGGTVEIPVTTNQDYEVVIPEGAGEWISVADTRVMREETIILNVEENTTPEARSAEVQIVADGEVLQVVNINQEGAEVMLPTNPDEFALVDLGLSVKWANYNMGADSPYEVGTASEWGHEEGRDVSYPKDMNISGTSYDLVRAELGGEWRLPTAFDFMELEQKCTWTPTMINNVSGNLVTGPNGNSIFLPDLLYWTGTARERSTENYDYIYGIEWKPEASVVASGKYNRPVQGPVRVYPVASHVITEIKKNTAKVVTKIEGEGFSDLNLKPQLQVSFDDSFLVNYSSVENGEYTFNIDKLSNGTLYRIRASYRILGYTITDDNIGTQLKTLAATDGDGIEAEPVDVGLSVKWASWNLGATCQNDKGFQLAWSGISVDDETDYNLTGIDISGTEYDPATTLWGPEWRLPTTSEWSELIGAYYRDYVSNAIGGILLKDKIFLPGSGVTNYMSGTYHKGCYFLMYEYCYAGSFLGSASKVYVRPVYDPLPQLSNVTVSDISSSSASLTSKVVRIGGAEIENRGFVYSTDPKPTLESSSSVIADDSFNVELSGLSANTTYYVRAYALNSFGTSYGKEISFTTAEVLLSDYIDEYGENRGSGVEIDGVVWAPVNCGYHPEDYPYGKLYQWGRKYGQGYEGENPQGSWFYTGDDGVPAAEGNYQSNAEGFYNGSISNLSDWAYPHDGTLWNSGTEQFPSKSQYDPCPKGWRVPTYAELNELKTNHSSLIETEDGYKGYWFTGLAEYSESAKKIFLPLAGQRYNSGSFRNRNTYGYYWSSKPSDNSTSYYLIFYSFMDSFVMDSYEGRACGNSLRCVQE